MTPGIVIVGSILLILCLVILFKLPAIIGAPHSAWINVIGLTAAAIVPILIFLIPGYYKGFATLMYDGFPLLQLSIVIAFIFILWVSSQGRKLLEKNELEQTVWFIILHGLWLSGLCVFFAGAIVGLPVMPFAHWRELAAEFMQLFYAPGLWLFHVVLVLLVTINLPAFIAGMTHLSLRHPAEETITQSVKRKRPDHLVEQDLASILQSQQISSKELESLWSELSPFKRWLWKIQFGSHARKSADLASLAKTAAKKHRQDTELGKSVHEMERTRRQQE